MGRISKIGDSASLAESVLQVLNEPDKYRGDTEAIRKAYDPHTTAAEYEKIFERLIK